VNPERHWTQILADVAHVAGLAFGLAFLIWYLLRRFPRHLERAARAGARESASATAAQLRPILVRIERGNVKIHAAVLRLATSLGQRWAYTAPPSPIPPPPEDPRGERRCTTLPPEPRDDDEGRGREEG
jgi:hypothetical protein